MTYLAVLILYIYFPMFTGVTFHYDQQREFELSLSISNHPDQQRKELKWSPILHWVARQRARDMAERSYFGHTNPEGVGPNHLVSQAGFPLPSLYLRQPIDANNIESIAGNPKTAKRTLELLIMSDGHRPHILGELPFFARQNRIGVGVVECRTCVYRWYWVILIAEIADVSGEDRMIEVLGPAPIVPGKVDVGSVIVSGPTVPE